MLFAKEVLDSLSPAGKVSKIPVGIHSNCSVTSVEVGDRYIDFNYKDSIGRVHNKRVWFPDIKNLYLNDGETTLQALERADKEAFAHMVKHMHIFLPVDTVNTFSAPDLRTAAMRVQSLLSPQVLESKKVNLKLIYDKDGNWSVFGNYPNYIEEFVEGEEPKLQYDKWETENRLVKKTFPDVQRTSSTLINSAV